jgi:nicotinamide riboside kinase
MTVLRITLLGAESTGKTVLSHRLADALRARGVAVTLVPEVLREWCAREGRTPQAHEQMGIAREQAARADRAGAVLAADHPGATSILVADTSPLMIAVYSDLLFADRSLYDFALSHQRGDAITLVMGLDLTWVADGLQRDGPHVRAPVDARLRAALDSVPLPYQLVYGRGPQRLAHAERALRAHPLIGPLLGPLLGQPPTSAPEPAAGRWQCEACGDGDCEHRLFRRLKLSASNPG